MLLMGCYASHAPEEYEGFCESELATECTGVVEAPFDSVVICNDGDALWLGGQHIDRRDGLSIRCALEGAGAQRVLRWHTCSTEDESRLRAPVRCDGSIEGVRTLAFDFEFRDEGLVFDVPAAGRCTGPRELGDEFSAVEVVLYETEHDRCEAPVIAMEVTIASISSVRSCRLSLEDGVLVPTLNHPPRRVGALSVEGRVDVLCTLPALGPGVYAIDGSAQVLTLR